MNENDKLLHLLEEKCERLTAEVERLREALDDVRAISREALEGKP